MCEAIRLYALCKAMKWTHLPVAGGLYDQHPALLDSFYIILNAEAKAEQRRAAEQKRQNARTPNTTGGRRGRRR